MLPVPPACWYQNAESCEGACTDTWMWESEAGAEVCTPKLCHGSSVAQRCRADTSEVPSWDERAPCHPAQGTPASNQLTAQKGSKPPVILRRTRSSPAYGLTPRDGSRGHTHILPSPSFSMKKMQVIFQLTENGCPVFRKPACIMGCSDGCISSL